MSEHRHPTAQQPDQPPQRESLATRNPSVDWAERLSSPRPFLNTLERFSLAFEKPISRLVRESRFNPLYHTGTITVFLLLIILGTGVYLTMFYQFGFDASYEAVAKIEANFIGRVIRALHRYASGAAVIFGVLHGWRTFFQDRFRGPRWLAWFSGILMAAFIWLIGITGYWLVWDQRADVLNQTLINLLKGSSFGTAFLVDYLLSSAAGSGWVFLVLVITVHLGLSALVGVFFWLHIKRLSRAKWFPPQYWMFAIFVLLFIASILMPVGMLPPIDPAQVPRSISIDLFYLFYLPAGLNGPSVLFWGGVTLLVAGVSAFPWLFGRRTRPAVAVDPDRCTGCTLCAADCPYAAIAMVERTDDKNHKFLAEIDPQMCVACGICIGTCEPLAMTLSGKPAEGVWQATLQKLLQENPKPVQVIFTCERHAYHNHSFLGRQPQKEDELHQIVPLTCIGMAHPNLAVEALEAGAKSVHFIGCPPEDCANREGNLWLQQRLDRERKPRLKQTFKDAPIFSDWLPPNDFTDAVSQPNHNREATGYQTSWNQIKWFNFLPAILLLILVFAVQIWLSDRSFQPYSSDQAWLEIIMNHRAGYPIKDNPANLAPEPGLDFPTRLILEINGLTDWEQSYPPQGKAQRSVAIEQTRIDPGIHNIRVIMFDRPGQEVGQILYENRVELKNYDTLRLEFTDDPLGSDPAAGEKLFFESSLGASASCHVCHSLEPNADIVGPSLGGVATRAADRVPGMTAEEYLRESILDPDAYIVEGFPAGLMLPDLDENLDQNQIDNLVAFLLTLK